MNDLLEMIKMFTEMIEDLDRTQSEVGENDFYHGSSCGAIEGKITAYKHARSSCYQRLAKYCEFQTLNT